MKQPTTPETQDATLGADVPEDVDFNVLGLTRVALVVSNTGGTNPITSVKVAVSLDGENFTQELAPIRLAVGQVAEEESSELIDMPVRASKLRVTLQSTLGTTATVALLGSTGTTDVETRVGGQLIGGESISGALSAATLQASSLTAGRVPLVGTSGLLEDDAGLAYDKAADALAVTGKITATGDLDAAGGYRRNFGPFVRDNIAASLTDSRCAVGATGGPQLDLVVPRAGSLVDICASFTVAPAGSSLVVSVFKNGSLLHATAILTVTTGATLGRVASFTKDTANLSFAAGDRVGVAFTTDGSWTATTSDMAVTVGIEC